MTWIHKAEIGGLCDEAAKAIYRAAVMLAEAQSIHDNDPCDLVGESYYLYRDFYKQVRELLVISEKVDRQAECIRRDAIDRSEREQQATNFTPGTFVRVKCDGDLKHGIVIDVLPTSYRVRIEGYDDSEFELRKDLVMRCNDYDDKHDDDDT